MQQQSASDLQLAKWVAAAAAGATVMYLLDPERGAARRARTGARLRALGRQTGDVLDKAVQELGAAMGTAPASARHADEALHVTTHERALHSERPLADTLADAIGHAVGRDGRHGSKTPAHGSPILHEDSIEHRPARGGSHGLVRGGALGLIALLAPRSIVTLAIGLVGMGMMARSTSGPSRRERQARRARTSPVSIEKTIRIDAEPGQVYALFANYDNFPRYMANVAAVRDLGNGRSHWIVHGPAGTEWQWNSFLTEDSAPRRLAWESEPGAEIAQAGAIEFEPVRGGTRVKVHLSYRPPAGAPGHALASLLGDDPGQQLEQALTRMKSLIESGSLSAAARYSGKADSPVLH
ncbi:MAG TPA: SRPBCC family protein [Telluria sp.]|jgi:uncharacterized membrane protein